MVMGGKIPQEKKPDISKEDHLIGFIGELARGFELAALQAQEAKSPQLELAVLGMRSSCGDDGMFSLHFSEAKDHAIRTAVPEIVYHIEALAALRKNIREQYPDVDFKPQ